MNINESEKIASDTNEKLFNMKIWNIVVQFCYSVYNLKSYNYTEIPQFKHYAKFVYLLGKLKKHTFRGPRNKSKGVFVNSNRVSSVSFFYFILKLVILFILFCFHVQFEHTDMFGVTCVKNRCMNDRTWKIPYGRSVLFLWIPGDTTDDYYYQRQVVKSGWPRGN